MMSNEGGTTTDRNYDGDSERVQSTSGNLIRGADAKDPTSKPIPEVEDDSISTPDGASTGDTTTSSSAAIQVANLQASFAEQTAAEMQQIVDWYAENKTKDRRTKVSQSHALKDNPLACLDDSDREEDTKHQQSTTARKNNTSKRCSSTKEDEPSLFPPPKIKRHYMQEQSSVILTTDGVDASEILPSLASTPSAGDYLSEAQQQNDEIDHLLEKTKCMADVVHEYYERSSPSGTTDDDNCAQASLGGASTTSKKTQQRSISSTTTSSSREQSRRRYYHATPKSQTGISTEMELVLFVLVPVLLAIIVGMVWKIYNGSSDLLADIAGSGLAAITTDTRLKIEIHE
jgi:hypothetical protein